MRSEALHTIDDVLNALDDTEHAAVLGFHQLGVSLGCKLFNIAKYEEEVSNCTERIKHALSSTPDCELHGGRCKGPVQSLIKLESNYEE
jgi:hypothetical protein